MFRLLPWSSVIGGEKVAAADEVKMLATQRKSPIMETPSLQMLKRKRTNSSECEAGLIQPVASSPKICQQPPGNDEDGNNTTASNHNTITNNNMTLAPQPINEATTQPHNIDSKAIVTQTIPQADDQEARSSKDNLGSHQERSSHTGYSPSSRRMDHATLRQTIESQLSVEILLKHNELRLIDQELAKCQVALDQLRRCSEIPYPGSNVTGIADSVSSGGGPAVVPPGNGRIPLSPSPWGVTDGPYSRHYAKWLLPDPRFDGGEVEPSPISAGPGKTPVEGRSTRGSLPEQGPVTGSLRSQRSFAGSKLQSLSSGYPQPKDKAGPMIIKRKSDNQLVKLVCLDCRRDNFSSTQGFINHCRIAHNRNFASHDAAAVASGEPVEVDEAGIIVGNNNETSSNSPAGYVHPLIRSAHLIETTQKGGTASRRDSSQSSAGRGNGGSRQESAQSPSQMPPPSRIRKGSEAPGDKVDEASISPNHSFKASPETPHLSALLQRRGMDLNLLNVVDDALTKTELPTYSSEEESGDEEDTDIKQNKRSLPSARSTRLPARTVVSPSQPPRPSSRKGTDKSIRKPRSLVALQPPTPQRHYRSPYPPTQVTSQKSAASQNTSQGTDIGMIDPVASADLSPNTIESNQAPSLVSDDGDYEVRSESESPSLSASESGGGSREYDHVEVRDGEDANAATNSTTEEKPVPANIPSPPTHHPSPVPRHSSTTSSNKKGTAKDKRSTKASDSTIANARKDQKHVSFVSPVSTPRKAGAEGSSGQR